VEINSVNIEQIVKQVLQEMNGASSPAAASKGFSVPDVTGQKAKVAMLTAKEKFEIKEYAVPAINDDEILVKVEGCGVCGTDAHEFKNDPFGLIPVVLGHEGSGSIVKMGKNVKIDSAGKKVNVGDKIVTSMIFGDDPEITVFDLNKQNISDASAVYGLLPDDNYHFNGWFGEYLILRKDSSFFVVNDLNLDMRLLVEPAAVVVHAVERAKTTGIIRFNSKVVVQGCGRIGFLLFAVVRTLGVENIVAVDGDEKRLALARDMGANKTVNFKNYRDTNVLIEAVKEACGGQLADFAFQCTGSPIAAANIWKFIRRGGGLCELGFFVDNGDATINPHHDICKKEITVVGSWTYILRDDVTTFDFLKRAQGIGIPLEKLITHRFPLEQIQDALVTNLKMEGVKIAIVLD
jgi:threonine dehydrogenase-like Zn-dependent dehydrogenase